MDEMELLANLLLLEPGKLCAWPAPRDVEHAAMMARLIRATATHLAHTLAQPENPQPGVAEILAALANDVPGLRFTRTSP